MTGLSLPPHTSSSRVQRSPRLPFADSPCGFIFLTPSGAPPKQESSRGREVGGGKSIYTVKLTGWGAELGKGLTGHIQDATGFHAAGQLVHHSPSEQTLEKGFPERPQVQFWTC